MKLVSFDASSVAQRVKYSFFFFSDRWYLEPELFPQQFRAVSQSCCKAVAFTGICTSTSARALFKLRPAIKVGRRRAEFITAEDQWETVKRSLLWHFDLLNFILIDANDVDVSARRMGTFSIWKPTVLFNVSKISFIYAAFGSSPVDFAGKSQIRGYQTRDGYSDVELFQRFETFALHFKPEIASKETIKPLPQLDKRFFKIWLVNMNQ